MPTSEDDEFDDDEFDDDDQDEETPTTYYILECDAPLGKRRAQVEFRDTDRNRLWLAGEAFENPPTETLTAALITRPDSVLLELWQVPLPLMSIRLWECLQQANVRNINVYPVLLADARTGQTHTSYVAFNITKRISAADLDQSTYAAPDGAAISVDFSALAIDNAKTNGELLFRLEESVSAIVVHASLKARIEAAGIDTLQFLHPSEWAG